MLPVIQNKILGDTHCFIYVFSFLLMHINFAEDIFLSFSLTLANYFRTIETSMNITQRTHRSKMNSTLNFFKDLLL